MKLFILSSHFVHMALLLSVIGLGACGKNHSTAGKTTTTTNGLAFLDTHGTVRTDVFLRVVPQAYSRGNNTAAVDTVFPNEQGYFDIALPGNNRDSWPFVELRNRTDDSAITWQNFAPNSDSVLAVELVPIVSVTGTLPSKWRTNEGLYEGYENHEGQEGYKLVVLHSDYSATVGVDGKYQLELPLQKDWIVLGWDNPDSTGSYVSLIRKDTTGIFEILPLTAPSDSLELFVMPDSSLKHTMHSNFALQWDLFAQGAQLVFPVSTSHQDMYDAFIQDSAGNPSVGIEYEEYSSSSWVALGLYFTPTQDIRMVDSVCVQLAGDGGIKVEWVQGKGSLSRAPGMFTIVAAQNEWSTHCISKNDFIIDPLNPPELQSYDTMARNVRGMQFLGRSGSTQIKVRSIVVHGTMFGLNEL